MNVAARLNAALGGRYRIERELGSGAMSTVYLARDLRHDRLVALKVLDPELSAAVGAERFMREIQVTSRLTHTNIIPLLDSGDANGLLFYVTPFASGESLRAVLQRDGPFPIPDAVRIAREVADALDHAHGQGVIHRDVKPENVLIISGHAVVADFGIARAVDLAATNPLTMAGASLGTPAYMSPEQAAGGDAGEVGGPSVDRRTDVYALGCVLFEMLAGEPPFRARSVQALLAQHATQPAPPVRQFRPNAPEALERIVTRALAKAPADRFRSAAEMSAALDGIGALATGGGDGPTAPLLRRRRRPILVALASVALFVAAAAATWRAQRRGLDLPPTSSGNRLAILPMANLSADGADRYFADGMTDELISTLSSLSNLRIIARSSVLAYAGTAKPAHQIGRELGVGAVLESSCRKAGNRLRITVRLIDAQSDEQRWTEQYDRELADVFAIQHDVATRVARALKVQLLAAESQRLARPATTNLDAYELYLRAKLLINGRMNTSGLAAAVDSGITLLERAVQLDSEFALAHAALGRAYITKMFSFQPGPALVAPASAEVARALALDSMLGDAYYARGDLAFTRETGWRTEDALRDYARAIALAPNLADAHAAFGSVLFHAGLLDEARREFAATLALDPQNRFVPQRIARTLWFEQRFDSSLRLMKPGSEFPDEHALVLGYLGHPDSGIRYLDAAGPTEHGTADFAAVRAVLYARLGRRADAERQIKLAVSTGSKASHFHHAEFNIAAAWALMGRSDEALRWVQRTANDGMPAYPLFAGDPSFISLRGDERFIRFLAVERARHERFRSILAASKQDAELDALYDRIVADQTS